MSFRAGAAEDYDKRLASYCKMFVEESGEVRILVVRGNPQEMADARNGPICTIPPLSQEELKKRFWEERQGMFWVRRFCRKVNLRQWGYWMNI